MKMMKETGMKINVWLDSKIIPRYAFHLCFGLFRRLGK